MLNAKLRMLDCLLMLDAYENDPNPDNWRTISGAKVHLTNGKIDGGAGGKFTGKVWTGKRNKIKPENQSWARTRNTQANLFSGELEIMRSASENKEENRQKRIARRAARRQERYEAKKTAGLAEQKRIHEARRIDPDISKKEKNMKKAAGKNPLSITQNGQKYNLTIYKGKPCYYAENRHLRFGAQSKKIDIYELGSDGKLKASGQTTVKTILGNVEKMEKGEYNKRG